MTLDELDRLRAEHERQNQTVLRLDGRRYPDRHEYLHNAWPAFSARLRAAEADCDMAAEVIASLERRVAEETAASAKAEAEVERLRAALRTVVHEHDGTHTEDCGAAGEAKDYADDCDCGSISARNAARAALGEP